MEKGKLNIYKSKKGKLIAEIMFGKNKKITVSPNEYIPEELFNGKNVEFEREKGQVVDIVCEGKVIFSKARDRKERERRAVTADHIDAVTYPASAPYNFIPLNKVVVASEEIPDFDIYDKDRKTGWIDLEIETKTPVYIRDSLTGDEVEAGKESKDHSDFYSPGGKEKIPGSSLRGMTRHLLEIVSFGKFGPFDDKRLYHRGMADSSDSLKKTYSGNMMEDVGGAYGIKPVAGYFKKQGTGYVIAPASRTDNTTFYKVDESLLIGKSFYPQAMAVSFKDRNGKTRNRPNKDYNFFSKAVVFKKNSPRQHSHRNGKINFYYGKVSAIDQRENVVNTVGWNSGTLVCTGWMHGKHMHWVINEKDPNRNPLHIDEKLMQSYKDDVNKPEKADLLLQLNRNPNGVPCFYITDQQGNVCSFGHTGMFRLAYNLTIGDHLPDNLKDQSVVDFAEAVFGNEKTFSGRVFFEDAGLCGGQTDVLMQEKTPKILSSPKPTTFQHYLVQNSDNTRELKHYDEKDVTIRGNKVYWHKSGHVDKWEEADQTRINRFHKQYTKIKPVKPNTKFNGRIRFENLSQLELGALLFSMELPEECFHKIGMGKPLGLGSIKISPRLYISDRKKRYESLVFEWNSSIAESNTINDFKEAFEKYVLDKIGAPQLKTLWETDRLKELRIMLDYQKGVDLESEGKTRYMDIDRQEYRNRPILPKPSGLS